MSFIPWRNKQREAVSAEVPPLATLRNEMDRLFETFIREPFGSWEWPFAAGSRWLPPVDITENDQEVLVRAEIPGVEVADLDVTLSGNQLVLSGEKKEAAKQGDKGYFRSEIRFGSFRRAVQLPATVDAENVDAQYADGVLTLRLKKAHLATPKRIEVKAKSEAEPAGPAEIVC